jgi:hypothetical protein
MSACVRGPPGALDQELAQYLLGGVSGWLVWPQVSLDLASLRLCTSSFEYVSICCFKGLFNLCMYVFFRWGLVYVAIIVDLNKRE